MQLEQFLEDSAIRSPETVAVVVGDRRVTYAELEAGSNRLAHALVERGLERGDRVAICLENGIEATITIFAALKAGAVFMPVHPTTKPDKLAYLLNNSRASVLVCASAKLASMNDVLDHTPHLRQILTVGPKRDSGSIKRTSTVAFDSLLRSGSGRCKIPRKRCIDIDLAALIYTSGSTGKPKGVMLTHLNMVTAANSISTYLQSQCDDIVLNVLPMSFDYGLYQLLTTTKVGGTLILQRGMTFPEELLELIERERVTGFPLVPTIAAMLFHVDVSSYDLTSLRYVTSTAAALPTEHIHRLRQLFPQAQLFSMYGLTECKRVSYLPPEQLDVRPESVGRGMPNQEVFIVNENGERVSPGEVGELVVRGSHVMLGYWENPVETAERLKPGPLPGEMQLHTGDLFRSDEAGYLYFVGRRDDIIKTRGEKVAPREVENALSCHADVVEASVFGIPDELLGSAIHACVTVKTTSSVTPHQLRRHCATLLEDFMVPRVISIEDEIPKTQNGKTDKQLLSLLAARSQNVTSRTT